jgi:hypothetical protein
LHPQNLARVVGFGAGQRARARVPFFRRDVEAVHAAYVADATYTTYK